MDIIMYLIELYDKWTQRGIIKQANKYVLNINRCNSRIVIAGPDYKYYNYTNAEVNYRCYVIVNIQQLLPWAKKNASSSGGFGDKQRDIATKALPLWLENADINNKTPSQVTQEFANIMKPFAMRAISEGQAEVMCPDCDKIYKNIKLVKTDTLITEFDHRWIEELFCPEGHLLYRDNCNCRVIIDIPLDKLLKL